MSKAMTPTLIFVRHGETDGNSRIRLNGATDVPLSDLGREQMRRTRLALESERFDRVVASPLVRSRESAAIVAPYRDAHVVADLRELDFGHWETLTWAEVQARDPETYAESRRGKRDFQFPGGDSRMGFYNRVREAAQATFAPQGRTLAALHKGVTKICLAALLDLGWDEYRALPCDLGSVHRLRWVDEGWRLLSQNEVDHLGDAWLSDHPDKPK